MSQTGYLAFVSLLIVMFTGIFSLSGTFVNEYPRLRRFKETFMKREIALWLHRFAIVAIVAVYFHLMLLPFLVENRLFVAIITGATGSTLVYYLYWKIKIAFGPRVHLTEIEQLTKDVWRLAFEGQKDLNYQPGDYFFIRLKGTPLTREGHPFSLTSVLSANPRRIEFMIKESGDWTNQLGKLEIGSKAQLEGPYGNYVPATFAKDASPIVLLSGGIGVTPNLALARQQILQSTERPIHFVWGLAFEKDLFLLDELQSMERDNDNFHLHLIFSNEEVAGFDKGFVTEDYLAKVGANLWKQAHFFACGPALMLNAVSSMLKARQVDFERIHIDEFGF